MNPEEKQAEEEHEYPEDEQDDDFEGKVGVYSRNRPGLPFRLVGMFHNCISAVLSGDRWINKVNRVNALICIQDLYRYLFLLRLNPVALQAGLAADLRALWRCHNGFGGNREDYLPFCWLRN
ncbi:hypothetical protein [Methanoculleus bovis]